MSFISILKTLFSHVGKAIVQALGFATVHGLSDAVLEAAINFVKQAATTVLNNDEKRKYVIDQLTARFNVPTSIASLATELAVQAAKAEIAKFEFHLPEQHDAPSASAPVPLMAPVGPIEPFNYGGDVPSQEPIAQADGDANVDPRDS